MNKNLFNLQKLSWLSGSRCVVTGGAGFIGSHVTEQLSKLGLKVTVIDDLSTGREINLKGIACTVVKGTITDEALLTKEFEGADYVFHIAAIPAVPRSIENPTATAFANIWGTQTVLECARKAKVKKVVYSASSSAYGGITSREARAEDLAPQPLSPYAAQKLTGEYLCKVYAHSMGLNTVSLRYFNIFGPRQNPESTYAAVIPKFIKLNLAKQPIPINGDGLQSRDFTYIENAVLANLLASNPEAKTSGEVMNVACGSTFTLLELVKQIDTITGNKSKLEFLPTRAGDVNYSLANISKAKKLIGYEPQVSFTEGLQKLIEEMQAAGI